MKTIRLLTTTLALSSLLTLCASAATYVNETFEDDTLGAAPSDPTQKGVLQVTTEAGSGLIGTDQAAHFNDISGTTAANLEYNVGASALGSLYLQFDLVNRAPGNTGSAANPVIFGVGPWSTSSGISLGANASRDLGVEFYQTGSSGTLKLRSGATAVQSTTYNMSVVQTVKIWVNDNDAATLSYTRPDDSTTAALGANSFVVWINGALVGTETAAGYGLNAANVTGDATLGRVGFNSTTTTLTDFWIDNVFVGDPIPVPEPTSATLVLAGGALLAWSSRRWSRIPR